MITDHLKQILELVASKEKTVDEIIDILSNEVVLFDPEDYIILLKAGGYRSIDGTIKKPHVFMNGNKHFYLAPKLDFKKEKEISRLDYFIEQLNKD